MKKRLLVIKVLSAWLLMAPLALAYQCGLILGYGPTTCPPNLTLYYAYVYDGVTATSCQGSACLYNGQVIIYWAKSPGPVWDFMTIPVPEDEWAIGNFQDATVIANFVNYTADPSFGLTYYNSLLNSGLTANQGFAAQGQDAKYVFSYIASGSLPVYYAAGMPFGASGAGGGGNGASQGSGPGTLLPISKRTLTPDPINIATGEDYFSSTDFSLPTRGPKLALSRKYCSFSSISGLFGYGWRTDFDINLTQDSKGNVIIYKADGTAIYFTNSPPVLPLGGPLNPASGYTPSLGNYSTLTRNADNTFTLADKQGEISHYDLTGRLSSVTDRNGNTLSFVYNPSVPGGTYIQDAAGRQIKFSFDANGHVISAVDPVGKTFQYGYDTNGNLVSITDPTGAVTNYSYNIDHKIIQFTNPNGHNRYYQYDSQGRAVMTWQDGNVNKITLNYQANNTTVVTDSLGNNSTYVFNDPAGYGLLTSYTDPLGNVTQQTWDPFMNMLSRTDARNNVTSYVYDASGNLVSITDPLGNQTVMAYTPNFNLISSRTDAAGDATKFTYDSKGNLTGITDALGHTRSFAYDQFGDMVTATDTRGNTTNFAYDPFGDILRKTDALGNTTAFTYE